MANFGFRNTEFYFRELSRLPTKDLLQLLYDPIFRSVQSRKREPISAFFLQQRQELTSDEMKTAYIPVDEQGVGFDEPNFHFLPEDVDLLNSCNGLICCRSSYSSEDPCLYVCNPLKKEWFRITCSNPDVVNGSIGLAFDPCQDITDSSTNFKLVIVQQFETELEDLSFKFHIYSSDTDSWRISEEIFHPRGSIYWNNATFFEGRLHWLTNSLKIVAYNIEKDQPRVIPVPDLHEDYDDEKFYADCIGESDGKLHYIMVSFKRLFIWSLEDYDEVNWNLKCSRSVEMIVEHNPSLLPGDDSMWSMEPLAFKDGYFLMKYRLKNLPV